MSVTSDAMRVLLGAVKSGKLPEPIFHGSSIVSWHWAYVTGLDYMQRKWVFKAYNGSLDAAKALHETVMPEYDYDVRCAYGDHFALVLLSGHKDDYSDDWVASPVSTSRAWLVAILEELIAKETE